MSIGRTLLGLTAVGLLLAARPPQRPTYLVELAPGQSVTLAKCFVSVTRAQSDPMAVSANSSGNDATWFVQSTNGSSISVTASTLVIGGQVTGGSVPPWGNVIPAGPPQTVDIDALFNVGAAGSGTVGIDLAASCGTIALRSGVTVS